MCGFRLTLRHVLNGLGLPVTQLQSWSAGGHWFDAHGGANPLLDHPLPPALPGDGGIVIRAPAPLSPDPHPVLNPSPSAGAPSTGPVSAAEETIYAAMDADWLAIQQLETQLDGFRKQLATLQGKVQSLNRDLSIDEKQACDSADIKEWGDVRRWLRDSASQVSRYLRDYTMGVASNAGQRLRFEAMYNDYVVPRRSMPDLANAQRDMEMYRKVVQSLVAKMQATVASASRDGEQRATQFLAKIGAKQRKKRNQK